MKTFKMILLLILLVSLSACTESSAPDSDTSGSSAQSQKPIVVKIQSLDDLMVLFVEYNYTRDSWLAGVREVPRITFDKVGERWTHTANEITVVKKKQVFFRLMAPLVLLSNEKIMQEREQVEKEKLDSETIRTIAVRYKISKDMSQTLTEEQRKELLSRVDIIPPSLALAQAAEESGWGTSRFTEEGNAFFGQWDFSGNGMVPKEQRKELGNYGVARFDTPLESVQSYMLNVNTNNAYRKFRDLREKLRVNNQAVTGMEMAGTLDSYSERGQDYVDGIRNMISFNGLQEVDVTYLSDSTLIKLVGD